MVGCLLHWGSECEDRRLLCTNVRNTSETYKQHTQTTWRTVHMARGGPCGSWRLAAGSMRVSFVSLRICFVPRRACFVPCRLNPRPGTQQRKRPKRRPKFAFQSLLAQAVPVKKSHWRSPSPVDSFPPYEECASCHGFIRRPDFKLRVLRVDGQVRAG